MRYSVTYKNLKQSQTILKRLFYENQHLQYLPLCYLYENTDHKFTLSNYTKCSYVNTKIGPIFIKKSQLEFGRFEQEGQAYILLQATRSEAVRTNQ